ncbi:hypothetical protein [Aminobacter sp. HY435]|uniref:hypothetical protein n=1 Tax=Aminobacter sp. HY435 TaxID=2970917 RepID=UPI0022B9C857|nr:hypothetical protein [Aminobacter sp. HY435]
MLGLGVKLADRQRAVKAKRRQIGWDSPCAARQVRLTVMAAINGCARTLFNLNRPAAAAIRLGTNAAEESAVQPSRQPL